MIGFTIGIYTLSFLRICTHGNPVVRSDSLTECRLLTYANERTNAPHSQLIITSCNDCTRWFIRWRFPHTLRCVRSCRVRKYIHDMCSCTVAYKHVPFHTQHARSKITRLSYHRAVWHIISNGKPTPAQWMIIAGLKHVCSTESKQLIAFDDGCGSTTLGWHSHALGRHSTYTIRALAIAKQRGGEFARSASRMPTPLI